MLHGGMAIIKEKQKKPGENMFQCHLVHHESHMKSSGIEPRFSDKKYVRLSVRATMIVRDLPSAEWL
jgi:hypothetical protein